MTNLFSPLSFRKFQRAMLAVTCGLVCLTGFSINKAQAAEQAAETATATQKTVTKEPVAKEIGNNKTIKHSASALPAYLANAQKFGEWDYLTQWNPPTLMWWNRRMDMVPVLYISFMPDKIVLQAITPLWRDTGILFYIKDKQEKQGINLTLDNRSKTNCTYIATLYGQDRQDFLKNLVTSRKARLITPSSYSQSLSLKHVDQAMQKMLADHPELHLSFPSSHS